MKKCNPRGLGEELQAIRIACKILRRANSASGVGKYVHSEVAAALAGAFVVRGAV